MYTLETLDILNTLTEIYIISTELSNKCRKQQEKHARFFDVFSMLNEVIYHLF